MKKNIKVILLIFITFICLYSTNVYAANASCYKCTDYSQNKVTYSPVDFSAGNSSVMCSWVDNNPNCDPTCHKCYFGTQPTYLYSDKIDQKYFDNQTCSKNIESSQLCSSSSTSTGSVSSGISSSYTECVYQSYNDSKIKLIFTMQKDLFSKPSLNGNEMTLADTRLSYDSYVKESVNKNEKPDCNNVPYLCVVEPTNGQKTFSAYQDIGTPDTKNFCKGATIYKLDLENSSNEIKTNSQYCVYDIPKDTRKNLTLSKQLANQTDVDNLVLNDSQILVIVNLDNNWVLTNGDTKLPNGSYFNPKRSDVLDQNNNCKKEVSFSDELGQVPGNPNNPLDNEIDWDNPASVNCDGIIGKDLQDFFNKIFNWIKIIAPIAVIVLSSVDFAGAVLLDDKDAQKKAINKFIKRLIIAVALFFIPMILQFILNVFNQITGSHSDMCNIGR